MVSKNYEQTSSDLRFAVGGTAAAPLSTLWVLRDNKSVSQAEGSEEFAAMSVLGLAGVLELTGM